MKRYYDKKNQRLVGLGEKADAQRWDRVWQEQPLDRGEILSHKKTIVSKITRKFLKPCDGVILEGGCGRGATVASLCANGYRVIGVDYAPDLVRRLNAQVPELDIRRSDVRNLDFLDEQFIGYWSLGVIEHFYDGYDAIAREMFRVLKPGGYLFLQFPYMSPLKRIKAAWGMYKNFDENVDVSGFQEFALDAQRVRSVLKSLGFVEKAIFRTNQMKGLYDEIPFLKNGLLRLQNAARINIMAKIFVRILSGLLNLFSSHSILLVMRKPTSGQKYDAHC